MVLNGRKFQERCLNMKKILSALSILSLFLAEPTFAATSGFAHMDPSTGKLMTSENSGLLPSNNLSDVADPTTARGNISAPGVIALVPSVSLTATGQTTLYTVPMGKTLYLTDVWVEISAVDTFSVPAVVQIGITPSWSQWAASKTLTGLSTVGLVQPLGDLSLGPKPKFAAGDVIKLDVATGATATTLTATIVLIGFLI